MDIEGKLIEFKDEMSDLIDVMLKDFEVSEDDFRRMQLILEKIFTFVHSLWLWFDIMTLENVMETEKDRFEVQKFSMQCRKELDENVEIFIQIGRTWKFDDYRCIDLMKRLTEFFVEVKPAFHVEIE